MQLRRNLSAMAAVFAMLAGGACGSNGDEATSGESTVKLGVIAAVDTAISAVPSVPAAVRAGIDALNERGGINGQRVELVFCNDRADPNETASCAREMVEEKVVAITGGFSTYDSNSQKILEKAGIPEIGIAPLSGPVFNGKNVYLMQAPSLVSYQGLMGYAVKHDLMPMALAIADNPAGKAFTTILEDTLKEITGGEGFVETAPVAADTADYAPLAGVIAAAEAKSVLMVLSAPQSQGLMQALEARGSDTAGYLLSPSLTLEEIRRRGASAEKTLSASALPGFDHPDMARFVEEMKASGDSEAALDTMSPFGVDAWVALQVVEKVAEGLDTVTAATLTEALDEAKNLELGFGLAPWTPSTPGPEGFSRFSNTSVWFLGFKDGERLELVNAPVSLDDIKVGRFESDLPETIAAELGR